VFLTSVGSLRVRQTDVVQNLYLDTPDSSIAPKLRIIGEAKAIQDSENGVKKKEDLNLTVDQWQQRLCKGRGDSHMHGVEEVVLAIDISGQSERRHCVSTYMCVT